MSKTYGNHTLIDELYRTPFGFVGTVRAAGAAAGTPPRLIKVFSPTVGDDAARSAEADAFADRARAQQKLAAGNGTHWGRIYDVGRTPEGTFYVTDYHPLTLRKLLDARLDVSPGALHRMVSGIVDGLRELRDSLGRAHGNLKPSNVLLVGQGEMSRSGVALTDMASPPVAASVGEAGDRFALGQIIHELVLQRPFDDGTVWPLPPDPTWALRLGRAGDAWRRLCEDLLAPAAPPSAASLAGVAKTVRRLAPRGRGVRRLVPLSVAALVLVAVAGAVLYAGYSAQRSYCAAKREWLGEFARATREPARRALYDRDPTLKGVIAELDRLDPATVECDARPVPLSVNEFRRARAAMQSLDRINVALDPESWPAVIRAAHAQRQFRARGWHQPADAVAKLIEGLKPGQRDLATRVDRFMLVEQFDTDVAAVEEGWKTLETQTKALQTSDDPVFQSIGKVLHDHGAAAVRLTTTGLEGGDRIKANASLAARAADTLASARQSPPKTDLARFTADLAKDVDPAAMTPADVERWLGKLDAYAVRTADIAPVVSALRERLGDVNREVVASRPDPAKKSQFDADRLRVEEDIAALERSPLIEAEVRGGVLTKRRDALTKAVEELLKYRRPQSPAEWIQTLPSLATSSDRVNDYWLSWKRVLPGRIPEIDSPGGAAAFEGIKKHTDQLWNALERLDKTFPPVPAGLTPGFAAAAKAKREQVFDALLQAPQSTAEIFPPDAVAGPAATYSAWAANLQSLAKEFPLRKSLLALADRPDEAWRKKAPAFWTDPLVSDLVEADVNRIARLQSLTQYPRDELMRTAAADPEAEVVLASWHLLGEQRDPPWPAGRGELYNEANLAKRLREMLLGVTDAAEREAALADVRQQGPVRWRTGVEAATSESQLKDALELVRAFGIVSDEYRKLRPEARFNLALYTARIQALRSDSDDDAVRQIAGELKASAGELRGRPSTADLLYKLGRLDVQEPFVGQDPGSFFTPEILGVPLEFKRVELRNVRPFYLQTTELTVDQFARMVTAAQGWETAQKLPWGHAPGVREPGRGPRGWEWTGSRGAPMGVAEFWLHPEEANDYPPDFLVSRFNRSALKDELGGNPSVEHPMQQMSAQAALYVAGLAGCRLPTSREWLAAYAVFEKDVARDRWNLRDQTWDAQRKHVATLEKPDGRWPDTAAFLPEGTKAAVGADASAGRESDGTLFFRRQSAPGGGTFHHLVGNVAEIVCDAPGRFDAWQDKQTPEGVAQFAAELSDKLFVIGGSALSAPDLAVDTPYPLGRTDRPYADVGVRLAFTAPVKTLSERLKWVLLEQPYTWNEPAAAEPAKTVVPGPTAAEGVGSTDGADLNK